MVALPVPNMWWSSAVKPKVVAMWEPKEEEYP